LQQFNYRVTVLCVFAYVSLFFYKHTLYKHSKHAECLCVCILVYADESDIFKTTA